MATLHVDTAALPWSSAVPFFGPGAVHEGTDIIQLKILSDRRAEGGGIAWLVRFAPPAGKLIRITAVARSDEHVVPLEGGQGTKSGEIRRGAGSYALNPKGQPHSAMIPVETISLVIYTGEPDEITALDLIEIAPPA
jgi:hypothetical protein